MQPAVFASLLDVSSPYRGFLCDAYGVFWNGSGLHPGSIEAFEALQSQNQRVVILSNSTQSGAKEQEKYARFGLLKGVHYQELLTSGDIARNWFTRVLSEPYEGGDLPFEVKTRRYWVFGGVHPKFGAPHLRIFDETSYQPTEDLEEADFIYVGIPHLSGDDQTDPELFAPQVEALVASGRVMVCANPDRLAQEGSPMRRVVRQGSIAALYERMGGTVHYIGKPYPLVYEKGLAELATHGIEPHQVLMIGDNVHTDIEGANRMGLASALVIDTGLAADEVARHGLALFQENLSPATRPTHWINRLGPDLSGPNPLGER